MKNVIEKLSLTPAMQNFSKEKTSAFSIISKYWNHAGS